MKCYCVVNFREPLQEMNQPTPTPQGTQVLLKVRAAGCATAISTCGKAATTWARAARWH